MGFATSKSLPRRTVLRGMGAALALPMLDAMVPAFGPGARAAGQPVHRFQAFYVPNGMAMQDLAAEDRRARLRADADPRAAGSVPRADARAVGPQLELELHPRRGVGFVPDRHRARRQDRGGDPRRRVDGPAAGAALRAGDAAGVAGAGDGRAGQRRRVHRHPQLRLHPHDRLAQRHPAAADGAQPARRVRAPVRRQRHHRARPARGPHAPAQEHPGLGERQAGPAAVRTRPAGSRQGRAVCRGRARRRAAHRRAPRSSATSSCHRSSSRRASRRRSRITWR